MNQDATKTRLLEAAGEEFAEKGFEAARVRDICEKADANIAAVNYHFGDKRQLYNAAVVEAHRCGADPVPQSAFDGGDPTEHLRGFIGNFLANVLAIKREGSWHHGLMLREMLKPTEACEALVREFIRPRFEGLQAILRRISPDADDRRLNALAFSVIGQCLHYKMARSVSERLIGPGPYAALDLEYLTDHISRFSLAALGRAAPFGSDEGLPRRAETSDVEKGRVACPGSL